MASRSRLCADGHICRGEIATRPGERGFACAPNRLALTSSFRMAKKSADRPSWTVGLNTHQKSGIALTFGTVTLKHGTPFNTNIVRVTAVSDRGAQPYAPLLARMPQRHAAHRVRQVYAGSPTDPSGNRIGSWRAIRARETIMLRLFGILALAAAVAGCVAAPPYGYSDPAYGQAITRRVPASAWVWEAVGSASVSGSEHSAAS